MKILVRKALGDDVASPFVWVSDKCIFVKDHFRFFRISAADGCSIVCQVSRAGADYERRRSQSGTGLDGDMPYIAMSEHYRNFFNGLCANEIADLTFERIRFQPWGAWLAGKYSPNRSERLALLLGLVGLIISFVSFLTALFL